MYTLALTRIPQSEYVVHTASVETEGQLPIIHSSYKSISRQVKTAVTQRTGCAATTAATQSMRDETQELLESSHRYK